MNTKYNYIVDIIVVSYKNADMTIRCIESIQKTTKSNYNILVVDNASPDDTANILKSTLPEINIIENDKNLGYAGAVNVGAKQSKAPFLLISNNDVIYHENVIDSLLNLIQSNENIAVCGPGQEYSSGSWQIASGDLPSLSLAWKHIFFIEQFYNTVRKLLKQAKLYKGKSRKVGYVDGAVMLVRKNVFDALNGFDEDFSFYTEEADFCKRVAMAGFDVVSDSSVIVTHFRGGANNFGNLKDENIRDLVLSKVLYCKKHLSKEEIKKIVRLEKTHSYIYSKFLNFLSFFVFGKLKTKFQSKSKVMKSFYNAWSVELNNEIEKI